MNVWKLSDRAETRLLREPRMKWLVQRESGALLFSEKTRSVARAETTQAERYNVDEARWAKARERLLLSWSATVGDPLPAAVLDELQLLLYAHPEMLLEYMGRGRFVNEMHIPVGKEDMFSFDIAGGKRKYLFRTLRAGAADERLNGMNERFAVYKRWIADPQAKVVLSMGGGGFRMFAATAVLKSIDALLDGNRSQISEVWGSSGGAFLGYVYAMGFDPTVIDELGYDLYHGRKSDLTDGSMMSLIRSRLRTYRRALRGQAYQISDMEAWLRGARSQESPRTRASTRHAAFSRWLRTHIAAACSPRSPPRSTSRITARTSSFLAIHATPVAAASTAVALRAARAAEHHRRRRAQGYLDRRQRHRRESARTAVREVDARARALPRHHAAEAQDPARETSTCARARSAAVRLAAESFRS